MAITNLNSDDAGVVRQILENYYLGAKVKTINLLSSNTASSSVFCYELEDGKKIIIRKSGWYNFAGDKAAAALQKAYELSEKLRVRGLPVGKAFCNNNSSFVTKYQNANFVVIEFLAGEQFNYSDMEYAESGKALGLFHRLGAELLCESPREARDIAEKIPVEKPYEESRALYFSGLRDDLLGAHRCEAVAVCQAVQKSIQLLDTVIDFVDSSNLSGAKSIGLLHNDFSRENGLYNNGNFHGFLDVDQLGVGAHVHDLANSLVSLTYRLWKEKAEDVEEKTKLFLRSYHREHPLPAADYDLILAATQRWDMMRILRSLRRHHYENDRLSHLLPKIKDRFLPRLALAPKILSFLTSSWLKRHIF